MLKIRLRRVGKKHEPHFYIVVAEHSAPVKGKYIEKLGFYNPVQNLFSAEKERVEYWLSQGAQISDTVYNLFVKNKIIKGKPVKKSVKPKKKEDKEKKEAKEVSSSSSQAEKGEEKEEKKEAGQEDKKEKQDK